MSNGHCLRTSIQIYQGHVLSRWTRLLPQQLPPNPEPIHHLCKTSTSQSGTFLHRSPCPAFTGRVDLQAMPHENFPVLGLSWLVCLRRHASSFSQTEWLPRLVSQHAQSLIQCLHQLAAFASFLQRLLCFPQCHDHIVLPRNHCAILPPRRRSPPATMQTAFFLHSSSCCKTVTTFQTRLAVRFMLRTWSGHHARSTAVVPSDKAPGPQTSTTNALRSLG